MTPAARVAAAMRILDRVIAGAAVEPALIGWARGSRYAGSGDRAAVRDLVFDALRRRRSRAALGGADSGHGLMLGMCREQGIPPETIFGAGPHAPPPLSPAQLAAGHAPDAAAATDLPDWLIPPLHEALGSRFDAVAAALRDRAPVWLRANRLRGTPADALAALAADGIAAEAHPTLPTALRVTEGQRGIARSRAYLDGLVELQDLSPQLAVASLGDLHGTRALDYCAGGGGKALALAAAGAEVTAHDADPARMSDLPARAARGGARIDSIAPGAVRGSFDLVVTDVPCSGSGTWRRDPAGRWRLTPVQLDALCATQAAILAEAAGLVAGGGRLAYMTCSLLRAENDDQIDAFLGARPGWQEVLRRQWTPLDASDGFFLSVLAGPR